MLRLTGAERRLLFFPSRYILLHSSLLEKRNLSPPKPEPYFLSPFPSFFDYDRFPSPPLASLPAQELDNFLYRVIATPPPLPPHSPLCLLRVVKGSTDSPRSHAFVDACWMCPEPPPPPQGPPFFLPCVRGGSPLPFNLMLFPSPPRWASSKAGKIPSLSSPSPLARV